MEVSCQLQAPAALPPGKGFVINNILKICTMTHFLKYLTLVRLMFIEIAEHIQVVYMSLLFNVGHFVRLIGI
jgi:hypothetical protein